MYQEKIALIDIGSNTIRLVIYGIDAYCGMVELFNLKTPARLSQYLQPQGPDAIALSAEGIQVLIETLASFNHVVAAHHVSEMIVFATAAIRQSANQAEIQRRVQEETGIFMRILSEEEEASYGQYAVAHSMSLDEMITIDIGGGSCEVTLSQRNRIQHYHSFPFGVVTLKERFFQGKAHNDPAAIKATRNFLKKQFASLSWLKKAKLPLVGIGGSARNIALVHQRLQRYPIAGLHGYFLSDFNLETTLDLFCETSWNEMDNIDGLSSDRQDIIIPANLAFLELYSVIKAPTMLISNQGLREGVIMHYLNQNFDQPFDPDLVKTRAVDRTCREFKVNTHQAELGAQLAAALYDQLCQHGLAQPDDDLALEIQLASQLYLCGDFIEMEAASQHTFYLLSNMNLDGFAHKERVRLAMIASFRNKSLLLQYNESFPQWFNDKELNQLIRMGGLLKFAQALNDSGTHPIHQLTLVATDQGYRLDLYYHSSVVAEVYRAQRHAKHFRRSLDGDLTLNFIPAEQPTHN